MWVLALAFAVVSHTVTTAAAAQTLGVPVRAFAVGLGPGVEVSFRPLRVRPGFVLGGWVQTADDEEKSTTDNAPDAAEQAPLQVVLRRLLLAVVGPLPMLGVATSVLGGDVLAELAQAPHELAAGWSPLGQAQVVIADAMSCLHADPTRFSALLMVKMAAWNLLPIPPLSVGQAWARGLSYKTRIRAALLGTLVLSAWTLAWGVAGVAWLL